MIALHIFSLAKMNKTRDDSQLLTIFEENSLLFFLSDERMANNSNGDEKGLVTVSGGNIYLKTHHSTLHKKCCKM